MLTVSMRVTWARLIVTHPNIHRRPDLFLQEIANSVWGAARLAHYDPRVMDRVAEHVVACRWVRVCISSGRCGLGWHAAGPRPMGHGQCR